MAAVGLLAGTLTLWACSGENLFSLTSGASGSEPVVALLVPGAGFTLAVNDSIQVLADVTAPNGATGVVYRSRYADTGEIAYVAETEILGSVPAASLNNYLKAVPGQVAGPVYVVVEVTDALGQTGIDSVNVTVIG